MAVISMRLVLPLLLLVACDARSSDVKAAEAAEQRFNMIESSGTLGEACDAAREVRDAWLKALDQEKYKLWSSTTSIECLAAEQEGRFMPANLKERARIRERSSDDALNAAANAIEAAGRAVENANAVLNDVSEDTAREEPMDDL